MQAEELFSISEKFPFWSYFRGDRAPWVWVAQIREALASRQFVPNNPEAHALPPGVVIEGSVYLDPTAILGPNVVIYGPAFIGPNTEIRPGAFIRGNVITGKGCVLGNSSEFKNCLLLDGVQAPHFNYVGDSVLGNKAHLGAGVICSNLRLDGTNVWVRFPGGSEDSGMRKLGALVGDRAEVGCNSVLNPGTILGKDSVVYPSIAFSGMLGAGSTATFGSKITGKAGR